ncbi:MAG: Mrp/NBP35 family ATP-binding protein [Dehalococcoidia bacterium]|nr:Mrp/NBP35 family ATP-binding protein [Dehalococcoidia bacterium]
MEQGEGKQGPSEEAILAALRTVEDPDLRQDVVSLGMIRDLQVSGGKVAFRFVLTTPACPMRSEFQRRVEEAVRAVPGVESVEVKMDADVRAHSPLSGPRPVEGVRNIIAVASNKGGVGKSTVAVNLAIALAKHGARVGLLDADLTGPNIPTMVGLEQGYQADTGLVPVTCYGVKVVSIGFLLRPGLPVIWRGPLIGSGIRQLLHELPWAADGDLDYLIIDLPPGTSDAPLSMAQEAPIAGVVIVTTPQSVSLEDAAKAVTMFEKLDVPVFGIIENMSYFLCPHCGERTEVFGHGGGREAAQKLGLDFLGEIPLDVQVRASGDEGVPIVEREPDSPVAQVFMLIAERIAARTSVQGFFEETGAG